MKKPAQTRIKITTDNAGVKSYTPQHKGWIFWYDFNDFDGYSGSHTNPLKHCHRDSYSALASAQEAIDSYIVAFQEAEEFRSQKAVASVTYVKYP